jgi:hypothetical protein
MDFILWTSFARSVVRYSGEHRVRRFSCAEQFRAMAFAQLTCRESLRDIEDGLNAQPNKLYAMGFRMPVRRSTLADANKLRDWRIYAELAQRLMAQARKLYAHQGLFRHQRKCRQDSNLDRRRHRQKTPPPARLALLFAASAVRNPVRENAHFTGNSAERIRKSKPNHFHTADSVRLLAPEERSIRREAGVST